MSNITKENAAKIFGNGEAKKFFTKGGTKTLASNAERNFDAKEAANILSKAEKEIGGYVLEINTAEGAHYELRYSTNGEFISQSVD